MTAGRPDDVRRLFGDAMGHDDGQGRRGIDLLRVRDDGNPSADAAGSLAAGVFVAEIA